MLRALRAWTPAAVECFTAIEVLHLPGWREVCRRKPLGLKEADLDRSPAAAAEIFRPTSASTIARGKESGEEYLACTARGIAWAPHIPAHALRHVESLADRVDHLRQLRACRMKRAVSPACPAALQPGKRHPVRHRRPASTPPHHCASRIYLDNFDHITPTGWAGLKLAQVRAELRRGRPSRHRLENTSSTWPAPNRPNSRPRPR